MQFEELSGRENQYGVYVADRWQANQKLTLNLGLRYEYYPLMSRQNRGIELLDLTTVHRPARRSSAAIRRTSACKVSKTLFAPASGRRLPAQREDGACVPAMARLSTRCPGRVQCADASR